MKHEKPSQATDFGRLAVVTVTSDVWVTICKKIIKIKIIIKKEKRGKKGKTAPSAVVFPSP